MKTVNVYNKILAVAEELIQLRGYNAFSYRDICEIVGVKTSSIHYHFPTKADLGKAVVQHHIDMLNESVTELMSNTSLSYAKKLDMFFEFLLNKTYLAERKMCLGGILASDVLTLPENIQHEVKHFFQKIEFWVGELLQKAHQAGEFIIPTSIKNEAAFIVSLFEGALLLSRLYHNDERLILALQQIKQRLKK